jgi:hypothetical protein
MDRMDEKLDALWAEYRDACPDPEPSSKFMPSLWQRIERQRRTTSVFRRLAQVCLMGGVTLAIVISMVIPRLQRLPVYSATYVDVLASELPNTYVDILTGDIE